MKMKLLLIATALTCMFDANAGQGPQPTICDRACWGSRTVKKMTYMSGLTRAIIHHTASSADFNVTSLADGKARVRATQNYHMDVNGWSDIGYHFLVDKLGDIFEGRLNSLTLLPRGAHDGVNNDSFGFSMMGYFHPTVNNDPPAVMRAAVYDVIAWRMPSAWSPYGSGAYGTKPTVGFLDGHRAASATACPGDLMYNPYITTVYTGGEARNEVALRKGP